MAQALTWSVEPEARDLIRSHVLAHVLGDNTDEVARTVLTRVLDVVEETILSPVETGHMYRYSVKPTGLRVDESGVCKRLASVLTNVTWPVVRSDGVQRSVVLTGVSVSDHICETSIIGAEPVQVAGDGTLLGGGASCVTVDGVPLQCEAWKDLDVSYPDGATLTSEPARTLLVKRPVTRVVYYATPVGDTDLPLFPDKLGDWTALCVGASHKAF